MARLIEQVAGHQEVWKKLLHLAESDRLPHAMAFAGPSGIGKKRVAWALAQALVCEKAERPCGECPPCRRVENQQSESVLLVQPQNGVIKLEAAGQVLQFLLLRQLGRARVVVLDDAQTLNPQTANALLKVIEEPPPRSYFILVVHELSQLLPTVRSRLQVTRFSPLTDAQLQTQEALPEWMVRSARGSFSQLENFRDPECAALRDATMAYLENAVAGQRAGLEALLALAKDREAAVQMIHFLQQLLRDWSMLEVSEQVMHRDLLPRLKALPALPGELRAKLWHEAFQLERDLLAHVDRNLLFETFHGAASRILSLK